MGRRKKLNGWSPISSALGFVMAFVVTAFIQQLCLVFALAVYRFILYGGSEKTSFGLKLKKSVLNYVSIETSRDGVLVLPQRPQISFVTVPTTTSSSSSSA